jgi:ornithine cyclodeaminase/alanine dehydrogenase-like protein (mu-crystallin family)
VFQVIEDDQARALIERVEAIEIVEDAYRAAAAGQAAVSEPAGQFLRGLGGSDTHFKVKGAVLDGLRVTGIRVVADGARTTQGASDYLFLADAETGRPLGLVSLSWMHRLRTASTALVTCRALRPRGIRRIALIGTGRIAAEFIRSCHLVLPHAEIVLASRSPTRARAAAEKWRSLASISLGAAEIRDALAGADVTVTLSDAAEQLFEGADLPDGALLCAMGGRHEFESDVLRRVKAFVVDEMDFVCAIGSAAHWIATGQITRAELERRQDATIGEILAGRKTISDGISTLAIIQGMAVCDLAIAKFVLDRASQAGPKERRSWL